MGKLTNCVLIAMVASPFVIKYLRYRRLSAFVRMKPELEESKTEEEETTELPQENFIRIPAFAVPAVIGKRGMTLRKLMYDSQADCVLRSYTPEELDIVVDGINPDTEWTEKFETDDWFAEASEAAHNKITYLLVRTSDPRKLQMIRLRIAEIIEVVQKPWKTSEFLVDSHMVGYLVGKGGRNIKSLHDKFTVQIQISDPIPENPSKCTVTVRGRDLTALKEVEIVMKETVLPKNYNRVPRYDEDTLIENGIYENVEDELKDLRRAADMLAQGFV
ncbi:hypothetical protein L5515_004291 [Caenorhabditis briggsae]|uniref:K Homology domain-containing protein n=2 Tax=Caenorhabditis briggsae TaxID=6238 RepID=A0AAE9EL17_CAEBR|nr:hypothetical protein L5515_004291 [Caenorhabditis briggsae]